MPEAMMNIVYMSWQKLEAGGVYMLPLFLVSSLMFMLILRYVYTHTMLNRSFRNLHRQNSAGSDVDAGLALLLEQYRQSCCPVIEYNMRLREELGNSFLSRLGSGGGAILLCGSVATLLGLLGTVSGMINAFEAIQIYGVGNSKSFAAGISEALLTTQTGLLVGVIGVVAGQIIKRRNIRLQFKLYRYFEKIEAETDEGTEEEGHGA